MGGRGSTATRGMNTIQKKLDALTFWPERFPTSGKLNTTEIKNLVPQLTSEEATKFKASAVYSGTVYRDVEIPVSLLRSTQSTVGKQQVSNIALNPHKSIIDGTDESSMLHSYGDVGIVVGKYKGFYVIRDGNHRVNAAILRGQKTIKVKEIVKRGKS